MFLLSIQTLYYVLFFFLCFLPETTCVFDVFAVLFSSEMEAFIWSLKCAIITVDFLSVKSTAKCKIYVLLNS